MGETIITIGRQYGSGGLDIGKKLAERLGVKCYDKELIAMSAKKSGMGTDILNEIDERSTSSLLYSLVMGNPMYGHHAGAYDMPINDKLFVLQTEIIRELAGAGSCVIVGRCASVTLRDNPDNLRLFIYAPLTWRAERLSASQGVPVGKMQDTIIKTDKRRANYYNYYTGLKWGSPENYDLAINSEKLGIDGTAELIYNYISLYKNK